MNSWTEVVTHWLQHSPVAATFLDVIVKSFVVLVVASAVCIGWRRGAAAGRHLVWFLAVLGVLGLPGLARLMPAWQRPLWSVGARADSLNEITLTLELVPGNSSTTILPQAPTASRATTIPGTAQGARRQRLATHLSIGWAAAAVAMWLTGAALVVLSMVIGRLRLQALRRGARAQAKPDWAALLQQLREELQVRRQVILLQSEKEVMPVTWGRWRPVILLPATADGWQPERRRIVLLHELAHVKRWDCLTQMIARLACAVYWFNPLVWLAARRMCIERERACDDLVLNGGCKASDYANHLLEIARSFRRMPQVAAIAMARSSNLEGRIAAIVDGSRSRRAPRALLVGVCCVAVLAFVGAIAAQKPEASSGGAASDAKPWFDARLRAFFAVKAEQAHRLADQDKKPLVPEVWPYFEAGINGDWQTATNLWLSMRQRAGQYSGTNIDQKVCATMVWSTILETDLAWEDFAHWNEKYVLAFGNDIINSIPPGSIYFGGTDPGRGVITAMSSSHAEGKPFFTLTQNALADGEYLEYLRAMYGAKIYTPTGEDSKRCFDGYLAEALLRLKEHKLKPGENVRNDNGKPEVSGQIAVMAINGLLTKMIFDRNPAREFYIEESFPLDWMYPYLTPNGLILKINRQPLASLTEPIIQQDHDYWTRYVQPMIGDWINYDTSISEVAAFVQKVHLNHDLSGFTGNPQFVADTWAQRAFSKLRSTIGGIYSWRISKATTPVEKQRMTSEAEFAFKQAYAICPASPEVVFRYVNLLISEGNRRADALVLAETTLKLEPNDEQIKGLVENLKHSNSPALSR